MHCTLGSSNDVPQQVQRQLKSFYDRKAIVIIRQSLDDNSEEAMVALHGGGLLHMAWRPAKAQNLQEW